MLGSRVLKAFGASAVLVTQMTGVVAQTTDAVCLPYFDWMSNSQHQSPCVVAANLLAVCTNGSSYNVDSLPVSTHYLGPSSIFNSTSCQCNTVVYSLMSACGACQGRSYISWSEWTANCPHVSSGFPSSLPTGLHVQGWAYLDPRPSDSFDQIRAQKNTNLTESAVLPPPTSTSSSAKPTSTKKAKSASTSSRRASSTHQQSSTTSQAATTSAAPTEPATNEGASDAPNIKQANMVGGVAVGVSVGGFLILGAIVWWIRRRMGKRKLDAQEVSSTGVEEKHSQDLEQGAPRVIVEEFVGQEREEDIRERTMERYISTIAPIHSPSSSDNTGTLPPTSIQPSSGPSTPTQAIHGQRT